MPDQCSLGAAACYLLRMLIRAVYTVAVIAQFDHKQQWNGSTHQDDVTSLAHSVVARNVSAAATVLLKNAGGVLPLRAGQRIALIGIDSIDPVIHGGGSGQVDAMYVVSPFDAISVRNTGRPSPSGQPPRPPANCTILDRGFDYYFPGSASIGNGFVQPEDCCKGCSNHSSSANVYAYFTWTGSSAQSCWCHTAIGQKNANAAYVSGSTGLHGPPPPPPGACLLTAPGFDLNNPESSQMSGNFGSFEQCCQACGKDDQKWFYSTWIHASECWCHQTNDGKQASTSAQSGSCRQPPPPPPAPKTSTVTTYTGSDPAQAAATAAAADVAVVFMSTTSSEGSDRPTLAFSDSQNAIAAAVASAQAKTVVVMVNPVSHHSNAQCSLLPTDLPWRSRVTSLTHAWHYCAPLPFCSP